MKSSKIVLAVLIVSTIGCASSLNKYTEECLFNLDVQQYAAAVNNCLKAVAANANDEEAAMYLSSAYAGRGGVDILSLEKDLAEESKEETAFKDIHDALVSGIGVDGLPDLRLSISTLTGFGPTPVDTENFYGQLGLLESIEAFALPSLTAQPEAGGAIDVNLITPDIKDSTQTDFIDSDDYLVDQAGWSSDHQLVKALRKNYCVLKNITGGPGFTLAVLRDQVLCQLSDDRTSLTAADFQSGITACSAFNYSDLVCPGTDPNVE